MRVYRTCLLAFLVVLAACGHSTASRIHRLDEQEQQLRASVTSLEAKQRTLRVEILRAQAEAETARCLAGQESYRAVVAQIFAEHATHVAEYKGCKAKSAKAGGGLMALGCGLAAFATGGVALALCGGGVALGYAVSEGGCSDEPPNMTAEDIRQLAAQRTGLPREPMCTPPATVYTGSARPADERRHYLPSPYGGAASPPTVEVYGGTPKIKNHREKRREARKHRRAMRKFKREDKRRARALKRMRSRR